MMNLNFFKQGHPLFRLRWLLLMSGLSMSTLTYYNLTGERLFDFSNQEQWKSSGSGYHK